VPTGGVAAPSAAWASPSSSKNGVPAPLPPTRLMERIMKHAQADVSAAAAGAAAAQAAAAAQVYIVTIHPYSYDGNNDPGTWVTQAGRVWPKARCTRGCEEQPAGLT
jgi:hypothetical protein